MSNEVFKWKQIEHVIGKNKHVGVYAATVWAKRITSTYELMGKLDQISLYDSSEKKWNHCIGKVAIQSPDYLSKEKVDCLVIANKKNYNAIYEYCLF